MSLINIFKRPRNKSSDIHPGIQSLINPTSMVLIQPIQNIENQTVFLISLMHGKKLD